MQVWQDHLYLSKFLMDLFQLRAHTTSSQISFSPLKMACRYKATLHSDPLLCRLLLLLNRCLCLNKMLQVSQLVLCFGPILFLVDYGLSDINKFWGRNRTLVQKKPSLHSGCVQDYSYV